MNFFKISGIALSLLLVGLFIFYFSWSHASPETTCLSCHELQTAYDDWIISSHRDIRCEKCHGTALSEGWHSLTEKAGMVFSHVSKPYPEEEMRLTEVQAINVMQRCRSCHENEYAGWLESGHSANYADMFLNETHNSIEQPYDDCLRCHGMFFEGTIEDVVTPLNTVGPWRLVNDELSDRPTIPCMACHEIHSQGMVAKRPNYADPQRIHFEREPRLIKAAFFNRHEKMHFAAQDLPEPELFDRDEQIIVSDDERQRLCIQCHAPNAFHQTGTSDDRTPRGVHEGFSCLACHETHTHDARQSCGQCHPIMSNCGLDVKTMNTTFANPDSPHNIHFVACEDCHTTGIPK